MKKQMMFWIIFIVSFVFLGLILTGCYRPPKPAEKTEIAPTETQSPNSGKATKGQVNQAVKGEEISEQNPPQNIQWMAPAEQVFKTVYFDFNKYSLNPESRDTLKSISKYLLDNPDILVLCNGYCDERGTEEYNLVLGENRALSVRRFLTGLGVSPSRLFTVSYGKANPVDPGHNEAAWAKNRRVEFKVAEKQK